MVKFKVASTLPGNFVSKSAEISLDIGCIGTTVNRLNDVTAYVEAETLAISDTAVTKTTIHEKLTTSNVKCPITGFEIKDSAGNSWTDTGKISLSTVTVNGLL